MPKTAVQKKHLQEELAEVEFLLPQFEELFSSIERSLKEYESTVGAVERDARQKLLNLSRQIEITEQRLERARVIS